MHRAERAQLCHKWPDKRSDTRGYRRARASYGPPRATRVANGPGTIGPGPGPAPAAATPAVAPSGGGERFGGSCSCCRLPAAGAVARAIARRAATPLADASPSAAMAAAAVRAIAEPLPSPRPGGSTWEGPRGMAAARRVETTRLAADHESLEHKGHQRCLQRSPKCLPNVSMLRVVGQLVRRAQLEVAVDRSPVTRGIERNKRHTSADAQGRLMSSAVALLE